jgi:peptidoglycan/LPS O-acetylase OafA/YrhL
VIPAQSGLALAVLPNQLFGRWAEFIFGMIAAELYVRGHIKQWARTAKWLIAPLVPLSLLANSLPIGHIVYGALFFCLVSLVLAGDNIVSRVCSWRPLVAIGVMSYSLYLVHQPVVQALANLAHRFGASPAATFFILVACLPLILGLAWLLFINVEKRTLNPSHAAPSPPATRSAPGDEPPALKPTEIALPLGARR